MGRMALLRRQSHSLPKRRYVQPSVSLREHDCDEALIRCLDELGSVDIARIRQLSASRSATASPRCKDASIAFREHTM